MFLSLSVQKVKVLVNMDLVSEIHPRNKGGSFLFFNFIVNDEQAESWVDETPEQINEKLTPK